MEGGASKLWRGLKVFALDGSDLSLPEALWRFFGSHKGSRGEGPAACPIVLLYDLFMRIPVAFRLGGAGADERGLAKKIFKHLSKGALLLIDTGFYSIEIFAMLSARSVHFVIPMRSNAKPRILRRLGERDSLCEIKRSHIFKNRSGVPQGMPLRIIAVHRDGFRDRRLITSLVDPDQYPAEEIALIYHERWHIETFFREYKHSLKAQSWHAGTKKALYVEVVFQMSLCVLTRMAMADAARQNAIKPGDLSFTKCLSEMRNLLAQLSTLTAEQWPARYGALLSSLATHKIDKRPGRSYERNRQKRRGKSRATQLRQSQGGQRNVA
jgi:hypothetical protein